jgi:hypothetical protein
MGIRWFFAGRVTLAACDKAKIGRERRAVGRVANDKRSGGGSKAGNAHDQASRRSAVPTLRDLHRGKVRERNVPLRDIQEAIFYAP